ncbi:MAG: DUF3137 domain-containing protein [Lachnospiraceae bacterium]|nr:DUF3137 domain-containing protein [Lachnospiraceae bacterium]
MGAYELVQRLERLRKQINLISVIMGGLFVLIAILIFGTGIWGSLTPRKHMFLTWNINGIVTLAVPVFIVFIFLLSKKRNEFKQLYKGTFVNEVLGEFFENPMYMWDRGFESRRVAGFGLTMMGNMFSSEDYLQAVYKGVRFEQADVNVKYKTSGKNSHTTTYFSGRMFVFEFPKHELLPVQVFDENFRYRAKPIERFKMKKINMESVGFNKCFDVKAARDQDAFYILTPQMMEKIMELKRKYRSVIFNFSSGVLYLGIECGMGAFDSDMRKPINYAEEKDKMRDDVKVIIDIIDTMNLIQETVAP